jgi:hypothetical protein
MLEILMDHGTITRTNSGIRARLVKCRFFYLIACLLAGCWPCLPLALGAGHARTADLLAGWTSAPSAWRIAPPRLAGLLAARPRALPDSSLRALAGGCLVLAARMIRGRDGIRRGRGTERAMAAIGASGVGKG